MRTHLDNSYPGSKIVLTKKARRFIGTRRNDGDGNLHLLHLEAHAARVNCWCADGCATDIATWASGCRVSTTASAAW